MSITAKEFEFKPVSYPFRHDLLQSVSVHVHTAYVKAFSSVAFPQIYFYLPLYTQICDKMLSVIFHSQLHNSMCTMLHVFLGVAFIWKDCF